MSTDISFLQLPQYVDYEDSVNLMMDKVEEVLIHQNKIYVLFIEYSDLYTLGSSASNNDLLDVKGEKIYKASRGGQITYHGPGQRVIYPIMHLSYFNKDIKKYINFLGKVLVETFQELGIKTYLSNENIGIWTNHTNQKLVSIGIKVSKWIAYYGVAVNINTNLNKFTKIVPCGISNPHQTSLQNLGIDISLDNFDRIFQTQFKKNLTIT